MKQKYVLWPYNLTNLNKIDVDYRNVKIYIFNNGIINNNNSDSQIRPPFDSENLSV